MAGILYWILKKIDIFGCFICFAVGFYCVLMLYDLLWHPLRVLFKIYFKKVEIKGFDHVKTTVPTIFTAAHPQTFMDAIALAMIIRRPLFFLIQADMMQRPLARLFLNSLHAIPIYHKKDGKKELYKNQNTFDRCRDILMQNKSIVIFSERTDQQPGKIQPIKKGAAKIAFSAEEIFDFKLDVQIVPVVFHYNTEEARPDLSLVFGLPIKLKSYDVQYKDHPAKAIKELTVRTASSLHLLMNRLEIAEKGPLAKTLLSIPLSKACSDGKVHTLNMANQKTKT